MTPVYLDCNATTPVDPRVVEVLSSALARVGNPNSRLHRRGRAAHHALFEASERIGKAIGCTGDELVPTSGATAAIATAMGCVTGHVVTTAIEHSAAMRNLPPNHTIVPVQPNGCVTPANVLAALRTDTQMVSVMQVNNETGAIQPLEAIAAALPEGVWLHIDASQSLTKLDLPPRADLVSFSGHKLHAPVGIGGLLVRKRTGIDVDQLRSNQGTPAMPLWVALAEAICLAVDEHPAREAVWRAHRTAAVRALTSVGCLLNAAPKDCLPNVLNVRLPGVDARDALAELEDLVAASDGAACSSGGAPSHVLTAMGFSPIDIASSVRFSWCHMTPNVPWAQVVKRLKGITC